MQKDVQAFLDEAYKIATDVLEKKLALKLGIGKPKIPLTCEEEQIIKKVTWAPVAQYLVITMLRPILQPADGILSSVIITREALDTWKKEENPQELAMEMGLPNEDMIAVMEAIADAIFSSPLLAQPRILQINGTSITVSRHMGLCGIPEE